MTYDEREACFAEAKKLVAAGEAERKEKRKEMERLISVLLTFDSESLGDAVKCHISVGNDTSNLTDAAYRAFHYIAEIEILKREC